MMPGDLPGEEVSLWVETTRRTAYPVLSGGANHYDAIVVGGGITGVVTAYRHADRL